MVKHCNTCGFKHPQQNVCIITNRPIDPDNDFCSSHDKEPHVCEKCGNIALPPFFVRHGNNWHTFCHGCSVGKLSTCAFCENANKCEFETNPSELPKMVQQRIQNGPMVSVRTIKNIDRIRETCQILCDCFDPEFGCMKENNHCGKQRYIYDDSTERSN